ncbi:hypothetical protein [Methylomagnum ishizawai]|uniref:hypothetical protein n=1 Tax=Methylomagnum ishizawai TaxID=1760988 RepID=UPI001C3255B6|nr:hypothetical protein [Methylomagnum ishizawai]BBL75030.1 hypothetical protein MishRS11D_21280 [Methylomagnum ishizawai]
MKWLDIKTQYPHQFILLGNLVEQRLSPSRSQIMEGEVLQVSDDPKAIWEAYRKFKQAGREVLFALPSTPLEFIVEDIPVKGVLR